VSPVAMKPIDIIRRPKRSSGRIFPEGDGFGCRRSPSMIGIDGP
jgi:hypothetical protein